MQILEFVPLSAVDPIYFESTYYLGPEKQGEKVGQLLTPWKGWSVAWPSMSGVARKVYTSYADRRPPAPASDVLSDEIRPFEELPKNDQQPAAAELLATQLIESISSDTFDAGVYRDEYRQRVRAD
jgi:DNA end-binding protein Ku